ncbi:ABC transporter permease [Paenibacillus sp. CAA11]|uniref:ABC transporter permease n=1 Tax=Paenibacillus sp. CAA11 TaxID=1532905 RepID=UPI000D380418|nr:ABC transporter permease [Paenibacillus sp. CAA11]AWB47096.1 ABC transporter permease [Paenibacillus sp. CAA11]
MRALSLALNNMKRGKGAAVSLFILIFIAALLLNVGSTIMIKTGTFYQDKVEELHDAHVNIVMNRDHFKQPYADFLASYSGVKETDKEDIILLPLAAFRYDQSDLSIRTTVLNADGDRTVAPLKLVEKQDSVQGEAIYLPYGLKIAGYKLGDPFTLSFQNKKYTYHVAGFFESTLMGTTHLAMIKFYLPDAAYHQLYKELGSEYSGVLMSAVFQDSKQAETMLDDYNEKFPTSNESSDPSFWGGDMQMAESSTMTVDIVAMILVAFAGVMVLVSLIVIKFRITNSIEDGMVNIGILKAMGYTSRQILGSMILQFLLIAAVASLGGIAVSYAVLPAFGGIISQLTGLLWQGSSHVAVDLISLLAVILLVLLVAQLSAKRIRKLPPVAALRGGIQTHNFKRNVFPLDQTKGGLQVLLACKNILANKRQSLMIAVIITAITFASVFSSVLYYNIAKDKTTFFQLLGTETPNVGIQLQAGQSSEQLLTKLADMKGVEKVGIQDMVTMTIEGQLVTVDFADDFNKLEVNTIYEGRYPKYDNEIVVTGGLAKRLGKTVGDTIQVSVGKTSQPFLITGLKQSLNTGKNGASMVLAGVQQLMPGHQGLSINVYLDGIDNAEFMRSVEKEYGSVIQSVTDVDENLETQSGVYVSALFSVMVVILMITILVVTMILFLVIQTTIRKRKKDLGISKALGYTTFQLMTQITLSFLPIILTGVLVGGVLGGLYTSPILRMLLFDAGASKTEFIVKPPFIAMLCTGILILAYLVSMLVSRRIKRITPYGLITE